ncbi:MAG: helix-turn-helix transcriptional regulator [Chitinophagaceae bacterium]
MRTVLIIEGFAESPASSLPLFTNGMPALLCRTEKDEAGYENVRQLALFGKSVPPDCWQAGGHDTLIAWFFKPFVLAALFNLPAAKLAKSPVDLGQWNPHQTNALRTQLAYAVSTAEKVEVIDQLLLLQSQQRSRECGIIRHATDQLMYEAGADTLATLYDNLHLNERTFQRIFKKYVGITPNQYRRICQFQQSFVQLRTKQFDKLTDVAYDNGFADQSHFIRSFREFTQTTPNHYLRAGLNKKES